MSEGQSRCSVASSVQHRQEAEVAVTEERERAAAETAATAARAATVAYTNSILLPGSSLGFLPNYAYQNTPRFNAYGQPEVGGFGYETPPQFPFRPQLIDMTSAQATAEPSVDPNNLTNQLATILRESFDI
jgi:hypothetical protein